MLGLLFFAPLVLHPGHVLYADHSDFLALELPSVVFQVQSYRETGELPRWCPHSFAGRAFPYTPYPLLLPFVLTSAVPASALGPLLCWMMVVHVVLAGVGMFVYARNQGLGDAGAFVAASAFMFGGAWMIRILDGGHFFLGYAWLPFVLLYLERAIRERSLTAATFAAISYALLIWSMHPQISFYAGVLIALWALATAVEDAGYLNGVGMTSPARTAGSLARWIGFGAWTAALGVALAGVQLLPMFASAEGSSRAAGVSASDLLLLGRVTLFNLVGPTLQQQPRWEEFGGLGLLVFFLAIVAPLLGGSKQVGYRAAVAALLILFALGGALLVQGLPGFSLFRQPARMFVVVGFPVAYLAGVAVDALVARSPAAETRQVSRFMLVVISLIVGMLVWAWIGQLRLDERTLQVRPYWFTLLVTLPAAFWLLGEARPPTRGIAGAWIALVLIDLGALSWPELQTRAEADVFPPSTSVAYLVEHQDPLDRVLDVDQRLDRGTRFADEDDPDPRRPTQSSPLGRGAPLALFLGLDPVRGYSPVDIARYKMFLQFLGNTDQPLVALRDHLTFPVVCNVPVRNERLLNLLGARWLLMPSDMVAPPGWRKVFEEASPRAFDVTTGGIRALDAYTLYENPDALPRVFVAPAAEALHEADVLEQLKKTNFRKTALLEGHFPEVPPLSGEPAPRLARVKRYTPNEIIVHCEGGAPGYLVLTDPWYPGWVCQVNGTATEIYRADYAFRGVALPAEACEVVFRFAPTAYPRGAWLTGIALLIVAIVGLLDVGRRLRTVGSVEKKLVT